MMAVITYPGQTCAYCKRTLVKGHGRLAPSRDHVLPFHMRGHGGRSSIVIACICCNQLKGDMSPTEWSEIMRDVPRFWLLAKTTTYRGARLYHHLREAGLLKPAEPKPRGRPRSRP